MVPPISIRIRPGPGALLALVAALSGCYLFNVNNDPPPQVDQCHAAGTGGTKSAARAVALGEGKEKDFAAYSDGQTVSRVTGGQGLSMLTPVVRVEAAASDPDEACLLVTIHTDYPPPGAGGGGAGGTGGGGAGVAGTAGAAGFQDEEHQSSVVTQGVKMVRKDGYLYTDGVIYNPVGDGTVKLTLTVKGADFEGTKAVTIHAQ